MKHKYSIRPKDTYLEVFNSSISADFKPGYETFVRVLSYIEAINSVKIYDIESAFIGNPTTELEVTITSPKGKNQIYWAVYEKLKANDGRLEVKLLF